MVAYCRYDDHFHVPVATLEMLTHCDSAIPVAHMFATIARPKSTRATVAWIHASATRRPSTASESLEKDDGT